jgi:hypothetical protein
LSRATKHVPKLSTEAQQEQELRDRVRRHQIHWQAWPEFHVCGTERRQVGFRLGLLGTHDRPTTRPISGSREFWKVYTSLHDLARWVVPKQEGEADFQVSVFDAILTSRGDRQDVMVTIKIIHQHDQPVDDLEMQCLADMEDRLLELGAPQAEAK